MALIGRVSLSATMLTFMSAPASAATWTQIAPGGVNNTNNVFRAPGHPFQDKMAVCSTTDAGWFLWPPGPVSSYTFNGTGFAQMNTAGFDDGANTRGLHPTASYRVELYIGTYNRSADTTRDGELYRWNGAGAPVKVPESNDGLGEGNSNVSVIPLGVVKDRLVVCVQNVSYAPGGGLGMYEFDGGAWKRIVGAGTPYPAGFGDFNNEYPVPPIDWKLYRGSLVFNVGNFTGGPEVWAHDGTAFTNPGKAGAPGLWSNSMRFGAVSVSTVEDRVYLGTLDTSGSPTGGGEIWSYDGIAWTRLVGQGAPTGPGFGNPSNFGLEALVRGPDLHVAAWNGATGWRIYRRQGAAFTPISQPNFGQPGNFNLAERPMYFNYRSNWAGAHNVMGCAAPRRSFYFAEGTTLTDFNTWVAVMNTSSSKATVTFEYMLGDGSNKQATVTVEPNQHYTREVVADVGVNQDVSILVTSDRNIVAERPVYFGYHGWCPGGHNTLGYGIQDNMGVGSRLWKEGLI